MTNPWLGQFNEANASAVNASISLGELTSRSANSLSRQELALVNQAIRDGVEMMQSLGHATTVQQAIEQQNKLVASLGSRMAVLAQDQLDLFVEMSGEYAKWHEAHLGNLPSAGPTRRKAA